MSLKFSKGFNKYGAFMGRPDDAEPTEGELCKLHKVPLDQGGYDPGGAYWGAGETLWRLQCASGDAYQRAPDRFRAFLKFSQWINPHVSFRVRP